MSTKQFYVDCQSFLDDLLPTMPETATMLGDHRYDDRLTHYTSEALAAQRHLLGAYLDKFEAYDATSWPVDAQIDRILMIQLIKLFVRDYDKLRGHERNPGGPADACLNGVYGLIVRDFAPLPERLKSMLGRLREVPRLLSEARPVLTPADIPPVWAQTAIESARQGVGLFAGFVPMLAPAAPELEADLIAASQAAAQSLAAYADWVEQTVLPQAQGDFAVGREIFDEILREAHLVTYDATELLKTGWRLLEETEQQLKTLAAQIDPTKTVTEILEASKQNHPTAEGLLEAYRQAMANARQFVIDHDIVTIPAGESIRVEETPSFMRLFLPYAAYMQPGFFESVQEGIFVVTPVDEEAGAEAAERKLRGHPSASIPVIALHEAYPGHHLQLTYANTLDSLPRKLGGFLTPLFIEGWAFYCEELMEQLGYIAQPIQKLARIQAQRWRAARIILDVSLHTSQMTVEEAVNFLVERAELEPGDAKAEVWRYTTAPCQPQSYLMGKLQITEIVAAYKRRYPNATMREMHDALLSCGSLPPELMRWRLFGEV